MRELLWYLRLADHSGHRQLKFRLGKIRRVPTELRFWVDGELILPINSRHLARQLESSLRIAAREFAATFGPLWQSRSIPAATEGLN
jgi:hypothetical protein